PDAFDEALLVAQIQELRAGKPIPRPVYDYARHARTDSTVLVPSAKVVILEGILVLAIPSLRELCDIKIFVDTDPDVRFIRRLLPRNEVEFQELRRSIATEVRVRVPLVILPNGSVLCGRDRLRAAHELGLREVPVELRPDLADDPEGQVLLIVDDNLTRKHFT